MITKKYGMYTLEQTVFYMICKQQKFSFHTLRHARGIWEMIWLSYESVLL